MWRRREGEKGKGGGGEEALNPDVMARLLLSSFSIPWVLLGLFAVVAAAAAVESEQHYRQACDYDTSEAVAVAVFAALEEEEGRNGEAAQQQ